jgi:hypothetical protein
LAENGARLKKFLTDQEEAVQLARAMPYGSNALRIDAVNVALSLAHSNAVACDKVTTMTELIKNAAAAEKFLSGES